MVPVKATTRLVTCLRSDRRERGPHLMEALG